MSDKRIKQVIYIGGVGRTGSTALSYLINVKTGGINTGELARLNFYLESKKEGLCTCGSKIMECEVYRNYLSDKQFRIYLLNEFGLVIDASKFVGSLIRWLKIYKEIDYIVYVHLTRDRLKVVNSVVNNIGPSGKKNKIKANVGWMYWTALSFLISKVLPKILPKLKSIAIYNDETLMESEINEIKGIINFEYSKFDHQIDGNYRYR